MMGHASVSVFCVRRCSRVDSVVIDISCFLVISLISGPGVRSAPESPAAHSCTRYHYVFVDVPRGINGVSIRRCTPRPAHSVFGLVMAVPGREVGLEGRGGRTAR